MKFLYFHQHFSTPTGSTGIRSYEMARALVSGGHQVTMVCGSYQGGHTGLKGPFVANQRRGFFEGIDIVELALSYSNSDNFFKRTRIFLSFAVRSMSLALTEKYDIIFATTTPLTAGMPGILARWVRGKPFVFEVRDLWPELPRAMGVIRNPVVLAALSALEWLSYRSADRLIGLSPGIVDGIAARGVARDRITLVPNGCDLGIFGSIAERWRPPGVRNTDFMAVYSGTHGIANGLDSLLDAAAELKKRDRTDIKLVLIGDGGQKPHLQARAANEGLENVVFHAPVSKNKLSGLLSAADMGLQLLADVPAFFFGTSPNKFFDYISAGIPVLNNYPGWLADLIKKNRCGFVIPPRNPIAFADALEAASRDQVALKAMGERARQLAQREFDRKKHANDFIAVLTNASNGKRSK